MIYLYAVKIRSIVYISESRFLEAFPERLPTESLDLKQIIKVLIIIIITRF